MKSTFFLVGMIIFAVILATSNLIGMMTSPIHSLFNLVILGAVVGLAVLYGEQRQKERFQDGDYDYDRENPNALVSGKNIAGTVYSSYPEGTPGLGWVL
jgi:hypothetical protein